MGVRGEWLEMRGGAGLWWQSERGWRWAWGERLGWGWGRGEGRARSGGGGEGRKRGTSGIAEIQWIDRLLTHMAFPSFAWKGKGAKGGEVSQSGSGLRARLRV